MAGFTSEEIDAAVARYVQGDLRIQQTLLGPVDAQSKFGEVMALIASTLVFDPNAIFYLIYLASNKLNTIVLQMVSYLDDMIDAINEMSKHTQDVTKTSLLGDAAAALLTVDQILTQKGAISSQAYSRYRSSITTFVDQSLKENIKKGSALVRPPQQARKDTLSDLQYLVEAYPTILSSAQQLQNMLSEFNGLNLPVVAIQDSVRRVRADLQSLQTSFESTAKNKDDRVSLCRDAYLTITAGKSVLDNYTTVNNPSDPRMTSSASLVGRVALPDPGSALGAFTQAVVLGTKSAPWPVVSGATDELIIAEDGNAPTTYTFPSLEQPSIRSYTPEPYTIVSSTNDRMEIDNLPVAVSLGAGVSLNASDIAADINSWAIANYPGVYNASVLSEGGKNYVKITKTQNGIQTLALTSSLYHDRDIAAYATLGFYDGQSDSNSGMSGAEVIEAINVVGKVTADLVRTSFEEGTTGNVVNGTTIDLPLGVLSSLSHVDDQLIIRGGDNAGYHRIVSVTRTGSSDQVVVTSDTPFVLIGAGQSWQVYRELLRITSKSTGLSTAIVIGSGSSNALLGLSPATTVGTTTGFRVASSGVDVDFGQYDVVVKDIVYVNSVEHTAMELSGGNKQLELSAPIPTNTVISSFRILSAAAVAYEVFAQSMAAWTSVLQASKYAVNLLELERVMNPLISNTTPSLSQTGDAEDKASDVRTLLVDLSAVLVSFVVSPEGRMDASLKMLQERGMDRAYDQLMSGFVSAFFGMDKDDAASSSYMLKSMRAIAQRDLPVSKTEEDVDDTSLRYSVKETNADMDYSDADKDENFNILGEVPDFINPDDESSTKLWRY